MERHPQKLHFVYTIIPSTEGHDTFAWCDYALIGVGTVNLELVALETLMIIGAR